MKVETGRKHYIDNLRSACIMLLIPIHVAMAWNSWEGNYIWFHANRGMSTFIVLVAPWYMPLLFVLAGMSANFALRKRTYKQFVWERIEKLFIPFVAGMITIVPYMSYYASKCNLGYKGGFWQQYKRFYTTVTDFTGYDGAWTPAHLWFIVYLFIISIVALLIIGFIHKYIPKVEKTTIAFPVFLLLGIAPYIVKPLCNFGDEGMVSYLVLYLIGYYCFSKDVIIEKIVKYRYVFLTLMCVTDLVYAYVFLWYGKASILIRNAIMYTVCWFGIMTVIGFAKLHFDQNNRFTRYLATRSFSFYILHYIWLVPLLYYAGQRTNNIGIIAIVSLLGTYILTIPTCEIVRKIPGIGFLFGMKKSKSSVK